MSDLNQFIQLKDIAQLIGISYSTARVWRKQNKLPKAFYIGNRRRWRRADIEQWIKDNTTHSAS